jgi:hypothetical protein
MIWGHKKRKIYLCLMCNYVRLLDELILKYFYLYYICFTSYIICYWFVFNRIENIY